mgnify:CR=1 FL=1
MVLKLCTKHLPSAFQQLLRWLQLLLLFWKTQAKINNLIYFIPKIAYIWVMQEFFLQHWLQISCSSIDYYLLSVLVRYAIFSFAPGCKKPPGEVTAWFIISSARLKWTEIMKTKLDHFPSQCFNNFLWSAMIKIIIIVIIIIIIIIIIIVIFTINICYSRYTHLLQASNLLCQMN